MKELFEKISVEVDLPNEGEDVFVFIDYTSTGGKIKKGRSYYRKEHGWGGTNEPVTHWLKKISATDAQQIIRNHDDLYKAIEKIEQGSPQTAKKFIERFINTFEE